MNAQPAPPPGIVSTPESTAAVDSTRSHHHRQSRNLAHEEGVRVLAEDKRAKRRMRRLAQQALTEHGRALRATLRAARALARTVAEAGR